MNLQYLLLILVPRWLIRDLIRASELLMHLYLCQPLAFQDIGDDLLHDRKLDALFPVKDRLVDLFYQLRIELLLSGNLCDFLDNSHKILQQNQPILVEKFFLVLLQLLINKLFALHSHLRQVCVGGFRYFDSIFLSVVGANR